MYFGSLKASQCNIKLYDFQKFYKKAVLLSYNQTLWKYNIGYVMLLHEILRDVLKKIKNHYS